jgi:hypothetical protein
MASDRVGPSLNGNCYRPRIQVEVAIFFDKKPSTQDKIKLFSTFLGLSCITLRCFSFSGICHWGQLLQANMRVFIFSSILLLGGVSAQSPIFGQCKNSQIRMPDTVLMIEVVELVGLDQLPALLDRFAHTTMPGILNVYRAVILVSLSPNH